MQHKPRKNQLYTAQHPESAILITAERNRTTHRKHKRECDNTVGNDIKDLPRQGDVTKLEIFPLSTEQNFRNMPEYHNKDRYRFQKIQFVLSFGINFICGKNRKKRLHHFPFKS